MTYIHEKNSGADSMGHGEHVPPL